MQARCQRCQTVFDLPGFGVYQCPGCGTEVQVRDPSLNPYAAPLAANVVGSGGPAADSSEFEPTPWERRGELGTFKALKETVTVVFSSPQAFFKRTDWSRSDGMWSLYLWVAVVPQLIGGVLGWLISNPGSQLAEMQSLYAQLGQEEASEAMNAIAPLLAYATGPAALVGMLVFIPVGAFATLFVLSGITHLVLLVLGRASGGWNATLKVFVYASCPMVLAVIPSCGASIGLMWATVMQIFGLAPAHRITVGGAVAGVVGMHVVLICFLCGLPALALIAVFGAMGGSGL